MGITRKINKLSQDIQGFMWGTLAFIMFPSILTLGTFVYETTTGEPIIKPESSPTLAGLGIEYLWVIFAIMTILTIFIWVAFGRAKPRT